jgi:DNA polymerase delta subunit 1
MVLFQVLTWETKDTETEYVINIFGRSEDGKSVCVSTTFKPYFFVKLPKTTTETQSRLVFQKIRLAIDGDIDSYEILRSKDLWGFQNNEMSAFMKLNFQTYAALRRCDSRLRRPLKDEALPYKVYESNIDPVLRFMHRTGIQSTGWVDTGDSCIRSHLARTDIDLFCTNWKTLRPVEKDTNAPFVIASLDIETFSSTGKFPDADIEGDQVFQIALSLKRLGSDVYNRTCLCYKKTDPDLSDCDIVSFDSERGLLEGFRDFLVRSDCDIITGWNIFGFDLEYIMKRAVLVGCSEEFYQLGKLKDHSCEMVYKKLSSSALGDNTLKLLPMPGRFVFDLFHEVKREHKLDSYSLNSVSEHFLDDKKVDMPYKEMFARFVRADPVELREVAEYCIKDTLLPHALMDRLCTLLNLLEMAKATWVPACYLAERGQQIKVFSQLTRKARELGFMVPTIRWGAIQAETYEGATVLEAQTGAYYTPITALDFEGLYPSIMMAHNLCYSTLVLDPKYDSLPGVVYETFTISGKDYRFAQGVPSLLPAVLAELKQFRKTAKKQMAQSTGAMKQVYNGKQLAYKISMNSVYGFTGASKGMLPCVAIAASVTAEGRRMIEQTKAHVEENFPGAKVRYGDTDSVMVEFDVEGRTGTDAIEYSWKQGEKAAAMCNSLFKSPKNLELEKVYYPYILYSKKRYAAKLWTKGKDDKMHMDYIDIKGLQVVRRDNTPFVREVCKEILDVILESKDTDQAKKVAHKRAVELIAGQVPMEKLVLSQKLAESYKSDNLAHVCVRNKIHERAPGSEPQSGDRVPYVLIDTGDSKAKQFERAEDPKWVLQNKLPLDYDYYFTNKFMNPVCDLLEPLVENPKEALFGDLIAKKPRRSTKKVTTVEDLFKAYKDKK